MGHSPQLESLPAFITSCDADFDGFSTVSAENNPANDYPEEELSSGDEYDDPTAVYSRYRHRAASDEEEFGIDQYDSEGDFLAHPTYSRRHHGESAEDEKLSDS